MANPERASDRWFAAAFVLQILITWTGSCPKRLRLADRIGTANKPVLASPGICFVISRWLPTGSGLARPDNPVFCFGIASRALSHMCCMSVASQQRFAVSQRNEAGAGSRVLTPTVGAYK